jgi:hypothetical protein
LGAALLASLVSFGIGEATYEMYRWNDARDVIAAHHDELSRLGVYDQNAFITRKMLEARSVVETRRSALAFGALGGLLGLALGLAGRLISRVDGQAARGALAGLVLGGGLGVLAAFPCVPLFYRFLSPGGDLVVPILTYAWLLLPLGAAGGLALGVGMGGRRAPIRCLLGGLLGAAVAVVVLVIANSLAFPLDQEPAPVPAERLARLIIHLSVTLSVALFAALALPRLPAASPRMP